MPDRYKIGIVGLGAIGLQIAKTIDGGDLPNLDLAAVAARDKKKAQQNLSSFRNVPLITSVEGVCESADVIVECAQHRYSKRSSRKLLKLEKPLFLRALVPSCHVST